MAGKKTIVNGIQFDSKLEAVHYVYLKTIKKYKDSKDSTRVYTI